MRRWNIFSIISLLCAGWIGLSAAVMYASDAAPGAIVLLPSSQLMANLPPSAAIVEGSAISVTLSSTQPGLTRALYANGAWLVLPAGLTGCLEPPETFR
mgnify:CR=1 FL=1